MLPDFQERCDHYVSCIRQAQMNGCSLVSRYDLEDLQQRHISDALTLYAIWQPASSDVLLDLGCGAGFLGVMSRLRHPLSQHTVVLCDNNKKKVAFLQDLNRDEALNLRAVVYGHSIYHWCHRVTHIVARAFGSLDTIVAATRHLHHPHLTLWLFKTERQRHELSALPPLWTWTCHPTPHMHQGEIWQITCGPKSTQDPSIATRLLSA